jgi:hypothetical protein
MNTKENRPITCIRLSVDERRYARALSKRKGCPLKNGSTAYALRWLLHKYAEKEDVPLD